MIKTSLGGLRKDEFRFNSDKGRAKMSFMDLFETRLDKVPGKREPVSINLNVEIDTSNPKPTKKDIKEYKELPENNLENDDEYEIPHKKVIRQHVFQKEGKTKIDKTYGPFTVEKPIHISKMDTYKFTMYTLLKEKFNILSGQYISGIGCGIIKLNKKRFIKHKMGGLKLESYFLNKQRPIKSHGVNTCVLDYVWDQVRGQRGFKTYDYDKLKNEIYKYVPESEMISTEEPINWAKACHDNVSIHAYDSRYRKFVTHIGTNTRTNVVLVYIVKDNHCFPITNEKLKIVAAKANQGGCDDLLKYMSDLKWTRHHENVTKLESVEDINKHDKENHIIVLPENTKTKEAINIYSEKESFYVEYLHWNNNGVLDGFIDHKKNMYLLNEEYDTKKSVCDKLFNTFKTRLQMVKPILYKYSIKSV